MPDPGNLRPMSEFDPSQWVLVHDQLNDEEFEWWPARREHYERYAYMLGGGRVAWDGLLLDAGGLFRDASSWRASSNRPALQASLRSQWPWSVRASRRSISKQRIRQTASGQSDLHLRSTTELTNVPS